MVTTPLLFLILIAYCSWIESDPTIVVRVMYYIAFYLVIVVSSSQNCNGLVLFLLLLRLRRRRKRVVDLSTLESQGTYRFRGTGSLVVEVKLRLRVELYHPRERSEYQMRCGKDHNFVESNKIPLQKIAAASEL